MSDKKVFIQVQASAREREMLAEIAKGRDLSMSQLVRKWINDSHKRVEAGK